MSISHSFFKKRLQAFLCLVSFSYQQKTFGLFFAISANGDSSHFV